MRASVVATYHVKLFRPRAGRHNGILMSFLQFFNFFAVLEVLQLCLLRYSPQHKSCWSSRQLLYVTQFFLSPLFLSFFNLEFRNLLLSVSIVFSCVLFCSLSCPSFYFFSTLLFIPCSVFSLCLFTQYSDLPYCFVFKSFIAYFLVAPWCGGYHYCTTSFY